MATSTVKITDVKTKDGTGSKGAWTLYALIDGNGNRHSTFDKKLGAFLQANIGSLVDIETESSDKGSDLKSARLHAEEVRGAVNGGNRDLTIAREVALKAAIAWAAQDAAATIETVIVAADRFTAWIVAQDQGPE